MKSKKREVKSEKQEKNSKSDNFEIKAQKIKKPEVPTEVIRKKATTDNVPAEFQEPPVVLDEEDIEEKIPHNSLLEKPDDVMPTIRAYDPKVDLEIKKTLEDSSDEEPEQPINSSSNDVNWWGKQ